MADMTVMADDSGRDVIGVANPVQRRRRGRGRRDERVNPLLGKR
jgi:hypothetical protein